MILNLHNKTCHEKDTCNYRSDSSAMNMAADVAKAAAPVNVYLPAGSKWYDFWDNTIFDGGNDVQFIAPIDRMPIYVRAGSIIPFGPEVQYTTEKPWDNLEIRVYPGDDGAFIFYEDDGKTYDYEKGAFAEIPFTWNDADKTLTIGERNGSYPSMLTKRNFNIRLMSPDTSGNSERPAAKTVAYDRRAITVKL